MFYNRIFYYISAHCINITLHIVFTFDSHLNKYNCLIYRQIYTLFAKLPNFFSPFCVLSVHNCRTFCGATPTKRGGPQLPVAARCGTAGAKRIQIHQKGVKGDFFSKRIFSLLPYYIKKFNISAEFLTFCLLHILHLLRRPPPLLLYVSFF